MNTTKVKGYDNIYAIGDIAYMETAEYPLRDMHSWLVWQLIRRAPWQKSVKTSKGNLSNIKIKALWQQ